MKKRKIFRRGFFTLNKKAENLLLPPVIFIVLNIMFFGILLVFVFKASTGALVYEQAYSKQIALLLDEAKPGMITKLDMEKAKELAEENELPENDIVNIENNLVRVSLGNKGGYSFMYFSDYDISYYFDDNFLVIVVDEKGENENV